MGQELPRPLRVSKVRRPSSRQHAGQSWYRKGDSLGHYLTLYGPVGVSPPPYQTSSGGDTFGPLEADCQLTCGAATPVLAEIVSCKLSALTAREVQQDLAKPHGLALSGSFLHQTAQRGGEVAVDKAPTWQVRGPEPAPQVATGATGREGTPRPLVGEDDKEALGGTLALSDERGARLTTEYLGALPAAGKATFTTLFSGRGHAVLERYPRAVHVVRAAGASWNWQLRETQYPAAVGILDFSHAAQPLAAAAARLFGPAPSARKAAWDERGRTALRAEPGGVTGVLRTLLSQRTRAPLSGPTVGALDTELNSFRRHAPKLHSARYRAAGLPIGSGVPAAAGKELLKARCCRSGRRWKRETAAPSLHLRAIRLSNQGDGFWKKVLRDAA